VNWNISVNYKRAKGHQKLEIIEWNNNDEIAIESRLLYLFIFIICRSIRAEANRYLSSFDSILLYRNGKGGSL